MRLLTNLQWIISLKIPLEGGLMTGITAYLCFEQCSS